MWKKNPKWYIIFHVAMKEKKQGKRKNKSLIILILILLMVCLTMAGFLLLVKGPSFTLDTTDVETTDTAETDSGLTLEQEGFNIKASWDKVDCDSYYVTIKGPQGLVMVPVKENHYTFRNVALDRVYRITVNAKDKNGKNKKFNSEIRIAKLPQTIDLNIMNYDGFIGDKVTIKAKAHGDISFSAANKKIAYVSQKGKVTIKGSGHSAIYISATGNGVYDETNDLVTLNICPEELDKPLKPSVVNKNSSRADIVWASVDFANKYQIFKKNVATGKYELLDEIKNEEDDLSFEINRDNGDYAIKPFALFKGRTIEGPMSDPVEIKGIAESAQSYSSGKTIRSFRRGDLDLVAEIYGTKGATVPQSLSMTDDCYVVIYSNDTGTVGSLISYRKSDGVCVSDVPNTGMGHGNGSTYNPNTNKFYVVRTHSKIKSADCEVFDGTTRKYVGGFELPKITSGIAYDISNNKYYLSKGRDLYVCDSDFNVEKYIKKTARYNHAQDISGYNGVVMVSTWIKGNKSFVDLYRASDGAYLGSYDVSFGEIESCVVDDGYLVILMNTKGTNKDHLYRTKERIPVP